MIARVGGFALVLRRKSAVIFAVIVVNWDNNVKRMRAEATQPLAGHPWWALSGGLW